MIKSYTLLASLLLSFHILAQTTVNYNASAAHFANPERGFYHQHGLWPGDDLGVSYLQGIRQNENITVVRAYFRIDDFRNAPLSNQMLSTFENVLGHVRDAGLKIIPRFSYNFGIGEQDATKSRILAHISQLKPILEANYDVIAFMNAGFIGAWGEWHSSENGLDNTTDRRDILFALLDALPTERMINLRYNYHKRPIFNSDVPLSPAEAYDGSYKSRTGGLNDCFVSGSDDVGTYTWQGDIEWEKDYLNQDNRYLPQSGETCGLSSYNACTYALADLERMRWDALNIDFHTGVLDVWRNEGCFDDIEKKMGYRIRLISGTYPDAPLAPGTHLSASIDLVNEGFGKLYNERDLDLVLRHTSSNTEYTLPLPDDPRLWLKDDGTMTITINEALPTVMEEGTYDLFLFLPDPVTELHDRPEYAVRLANQNTWESSTGYNDLQVQIDISTATGIREVVIKEVIHPNPATNFIHLNTGKEPVEIISLTGRVVRLGDSQLGKLDISDLDAGIYFLRYRNYGTRYLAKFIKQ